MESLEGFSRRPDLKKRQKKRKNVERDSSDSEDENSSSYKVLSAEEIIKISKFDKNIRLTSNDVPFEHLWTLIDVSLTVKGASEDRAYSRSANYRQNIRRGNAIVQMYSKEFKTSVQDTFFVRRGLQKFFDLYIEFIEDE